MSVSGSNPLTRFVEWHSAHMPFQFWPLRVQCSQSAGGMCRARVEEEPALPRDVPGQRERLHPPAREADQVLLQRLPAEGVGDLVALRRAVRAVGLDEELRRRRGGSGPASRRRRTTTPGEVAPHRRVGRLGHRQVVVRAGPRLRRLLVAARARRPADERRLGGHRALRRGGAQRLARQVERTRGDDHAGGGERRVPPGREGVGHAVSSSSPATARTPSGGSAPRRRP